MGYAIKNDKSSQRGVESEDDVGPDEYYSEEVLDPITGIIPTADEVLRGALAERDLRLSLAAIRIAPLQDAVDLGESTPEEEAALLAWKRYRVQLNRVDQQVGFPQEIEWPKQP